MIVARYVVATCPLCQQQLVFDTVSPDYTTANVTAAALAHYGTHTLQEWATALQAIQDRDAQQDQLCRTPHWMMPSA